MSDINKPGNMLYNPIIDPFEEMIENQELLALAKERSAEIHSGKSGVHTWEAIKAKHGL